MLKMFKVIYTLLESMDSIENCLSPNLDSLSGLKISVLVLVKVSIKKAHCYGPFNTVKREIQN
jgi:hypothetical protein